LLAPEDEDRSAYLAVERLDLVGEALLGLGDLAVERILSSGSEPGLHVRGERVVAQLTVEGAAEVRRDDRPVDRRGELLEDLDVVTDEPEDRRPPGAECLRVEALFSVKRAKSAQVNSERDGAAEVV